MVKRSWPLFLMGLCVALCVGFQISLLFGAERSLRDSTLADRQLRKVALIAYNLWQERGELNEADVWKKIGRRDPLLDPWGNPYLLKANPMQLLALSHGPDGIFGSEDDLSLSLPRHLSPPDAPSSLEEGTPSQEELKSMGSGAQ